MDRSAFIRGLLDDQSDPQLPQSVPQNDFGPRAYGLLNSLFPDPYEAAGEAVQQFRAGNPIDAFTTMYGAMPSTGMARVAAPQHGISKLRLDRPVSEMTRDVSTVGEMKPRSNLDPAALKGSTLIAGVGDRTAANEILHGYNGRKLAFDTSLEGGPDFSRVNPDIWASAQSKITKLQNKANAVDNPLLFYTAMGNRAGDFSHHITDAVLGDLPNQKITRNNLKALNGLLGDAVEGFPGLLSPGLREFMLTRPDARSNFVKRLDMGDAQKLGAPDVGHARFATTNPDLIDTPLNYGGYAISRMRPGASTISAPSVPHTTYPVHLAGDYMGGLEHQIPPEIAFRDFVSQQRPETLANPAKLGWLIEKIIPTQKVDQQWVDEVSAYLERKRNGL